MWGGLLMAAGKGKLVIPVPDTVEGIPAEGGATFRILNHILSHIPH